jgi:hypothetical protein
MRLVSIHPGVSVENVCEKTGFPVEMADQPALTRTPTAEEVRLIRDVIDPQGLRLKEVAA